MNNNINNTILIHNKFDDRLCWCNSEALLAECKGVVQLIMDVQD